MGIALHLSELTKLSNGFALFIVNICALHLSELTKLSNMSVIPESSVEALHLSELTKLSNLKFTLRLSPSDAFCEMLLIQRCIYHT